MPPAFDQAGRIEFNVAFVLDIGRANVVRLQIGKQGRGMTTSTTNLLAFKQPLAALRRRRKLAVDQKRAG